jgi:hypothetical protein
MSYSHRVAVKCEEMVLTGKGRRLGLVMLVARKQKIMANGVIISLHEFEHPSRCYRRLQAVKMCEFWIAERIMYGDVRLG